MSIEAIEVKLKTALAAARAKAETGTGAELYELNAAVTAAHAELSAAITEGAQPCLSCGKPPHGMPQSIVMGREVVRGFEIGCVNCRDHRAVGFDRENALQKWHAGPVANGWRPPRGGEKLELDENGEIFRLSGDSRVSCRTEPLLSE